jgi:hypothetical protein
LGDTAAAMNPPKRRFDTRKDHQLSAAGLHGAKGSERIPSLLFRDTRAITSGASSERGVCQLLRAPS